MKRANRLIHIGENEVLSFVDHISKNFLNRIVTSNWVEGH